MEFPLKAFGIPLGLLLSANSLFAPNCVCQFLLHPQHDSDKRRNFQDEPFQRGLAALGENRLQEALESLTEAELQRPEDSRIRNFRGIVLARLGKMSEARDEYQQAIQREPQMEDAYRNLGFLEWTEHRLPEARDALEHALKLSPSDSFARYYLGRVQLDAQRYADAFHELERSDVAWTSEPVFLIQVATGYVALGRKEEARKALRRLEPHSLSGLQSAQVASLLVAVQEPDQAIELLRQWSERSSAPTSWAAFDLALTYLLSGRYQKAIEQTRRYEDVVQTQPPKPDEAAFLWSVTGIAYARLGQGDQAVDALRSAARADPHQEESWLNLTRELMELNRFEEAIAAIQEGLFSLPNSYALHLRLGAAQLAAGRFSASEDVFRGLVNAGDPLPTSYVGLGQVLLRQGRAEEAASELSTAQKKIGPNFLLSYFLGLALDRAGKPSDGLAAFQEAVRLNPNSAEAHLGLGKTELALGHPKEAIVQLQDTLRLSPGNAQAQHLLPLAYRRAGNTKSDLQSGPVPTEAPAPAESNLVGDFLLPKWQTPEEENFRQVP